MRVIEKTWRGEQEFELEDLLRGTIYYSAQGDYGGVIEDTEKRVDLLCKVVGKLLAFICERDASSISIKEAYEICGGYNEIEEVK